MQPRWRGTDLVFASDRPAGGTSTCSTASSVRAVHEAEAEFAEPQWVLGMTPYAALPGERRRLVCSVVTDGSPGLALLDVDSGELTPVAAPGVGADSLAAGPGGTAAVLTHPDGPAELAVSGPTAPGPPSGRAPGARPTPRRCPWRAT